MAEAVLDDTSPFKVAKEKFTGGGGGGGTGDIRAAIEKLEVDESLTISAERVGTRYHSVQQVASAMSAERGCRYRTRRQPNGDMKVYRTD